ncbi:MAG: elongation factor G [Oligoflexia bacterium]|nr:elongation factor G [Oligoflexia bacterium]
MDPIRAENTRNVAMIAHGGAGKTALIQALLFQAHAINSLEERAAVMRVEPEEVAHKIAITPHVGHFDWKDHTINIIDTPGYFNFLEGTRGVLPGADGAVLVISGVDGVKPETVRLWKMLEEQELPVIAFMSHTDLPESDFMHAIQSTRDQLHASAQPIVIPIRTGPQELGIVDLIRMKAWSTRDGRSAPCEIPGHLLSEVTRLRTQLVEKVVENDEALLEKYLGGEELSIEEIEQALRRSVIAREFIPVLCGSALANSGIEALMEAIVHYLPSPPDRDATRPFQGVALGDAERTEVRRCDPEIPFSAIVLKTVIDQFSGKLSMVRVISGTLAPHQRMLNATQQTEQRSGHLYLVQGAKLEATERLYAGQIGAIAKMNETSTGDTLCDVDNALRYPQVKYAEAPIMYAVEAQDPKSEEKVAAGLARLAEEDPTLHLYRDGQTHEMILSGMGQTHIDIALERLTRKYGGKARLRAPKVPYRETLSKAVKVQGKLKKQTGGHGQFANCFIEVTPLPRNSGFEFVDLVTGGAIPRQYIGSIKKGVEESLLRGPLNGSPVTDLKVAVYDGSYHQVDSSDYAFQTAGAIAMKLAYEQAHPVLLEPIMALDVIVPDQYTGEVLKDLSSRRGRVQNLNATEGAQEIEAQVPMVELLEYGAILGTLTSGQGTFTMSVSHYQDVPSHLQEKLVTRRGEEQASA